MGRVTGHARNRQQYRENRSAHVATIGALVSSCSKNVSSSDYQVQQLGLCDEEPLPWLHQSAVDLPSLHGSDPASPCLASAACLPGTHDGRPELCRQKPAPNSTSRKNATSAPLNLQKSNTDNSNEQACSNHYVCQGLMI